MVAALTRLFGLHNLALAEDVVQDAFCRALEVWKLRGIPENPSAWLMTTAKNRALDVLRREQTARTYAPDLGRLLETEWTLAPAVDEIFARSGGNAVRRSNPVQRFWRDAHVGLQHAIHIPGSIYHSTALISMGIEPEGQLRALI